MIRRVCQNEMHRRAIGASLAVMPLPFYVTVGEHTRSPYSDNKAKLRQLYAKMGALCGVGYLECGE